MASTMTTKKGGRIVINAEGEKIYIIRRYLQPMTPQIEPTNPVPIITFDILCIKSVVSVIVQ